MLSDFKIAARLLAKSPGFTAVAVLTLALATGVNSAVIALINATILRPVVTQQPEQIVNLFNGQQGATRNFRLFSRSEYLLLGEAQDTFAAVSATYLTSAGVTANDGEVRRLAGFFTTENYFSMLGVKPALGRFYNADECLPNANIPVVVTSHGLWQRSGGQPDFVGSTLHLNGKSYTVIGVTPEGFNGPLVFSSIDLWVPFGVFTQFSSTPTKDLTAPENHTLYLTARLAEGVTLESLPGRLPALAQRLTALRSDDRKGPRELHAETPSRQNISSQPSGGDRSVPVAIGLFSMSGCVLLIACLNLANMLLARGAAREKEVALRLALGADRWHIVRQLLAEGLLLSALGGSLGLLMAVWGNDLLLQSLVATADLNGHTMALDLSPDGRVLGATFLLCLLATLGFSLGPALKSSRADLVHALKRQGGEPDATGSLHRFFSVRHCLVMGQLALSLMLVFSAALFVRGALKAANVAPGFDPTGTLVADLDYSLTNLRPDDAKRSLFSALEHIAAQPGVQQVAAATFVPYSSRSESRSVRPAREAAPATDGDQAVPARSALFTPVTAGYFEAVGAPLIHGRDFTAAETRDPSAPRVAIIDEELAKKLFPAGDALGGHVRLGSVEAEVVGICAPHRHSNRRANVPYRVFVPYASGHDGRVFFLIRYEGKDPTVAAAAISSLRAALRTLDAGLPVLQVNTLLRLVEQDSTTWLSRMGAILFGLFGAIALLLAVVGVYGVKAYAITRRTREIGIRMALGAQSHDVFILLLRQGVLQITVALTGGLFLAFGAGKVLAKMLYGVSATDPLALGFSSAFLAIAALLACFFPARRAIRVDPMVALRAE